MTIVTLLLMLLIIGAVIYGVKLALAGNWRDLVIMIVVVILVIWLLGAFGISLPSLPRG